MKKENPDRPDVLALAAYDGDEIAALAGASADTDALWQVGIDVKERYRGHGLGTTLVSLLCDRIEALGKTPFYGTVLANLHSQNIALNTGFYPAWVEISSFKREETKRVNRNEFKVHHRDRCKRTQLKKYQCKAAA